MKDDSIKKIEVYSLAELPETNEQEKYFPCIGGRKNYECFLESRNLSRAEFMIKYANDIDICHIPIFEDENLIIRQDAQIPIPGFYIVATKEKYRKICDMDMELYKKCLYYVAMIRQTLAEEFDIDRFFMYYDEHYKKPSSTHFWVMPIYNEILEQYGLAATILKKDVWKYQDLFEFQYTKNDIYKINNYMRKILKRK